jgi:hypothetical protein
MKKLSKKEVIYISIVAAVLLLLWFFAKRGTVTTVTNGAGDPANTGYLTFNIPPINSDGMTQPVFGNINIPGISLGGSSGCTSCQFSSYYGSSQDLAANLGSSGADAIASSLVEATGGMASQVVVGVSNTGSVYEQPYAVSYSFNGSGPAPVDNSPGTPPANAGVYYPQFNGNV